MQTTCSKFHNIKYKLQLGKSNCVLLENEESVRGLISRITNNWCGLKRICQSYTMSVNVTVTAQVCVNNDLAYFPNRCRA